MTLGPPAEFSVFGASLIGLGVGFLSGLLGVGGGFLLAPLANVLLGVPLSVVGPSSLCQMQGTSLAGLLYHRRQGQFDLRVALILLGGVLCGTEAGVSILEHLKGLGAVQLAGGTFARGEVALSVVFTAMLALIGAFVLADAVLAGRRTPAGTGPDCERRAGLLSAVRLPPYVTPAGGQPVSAVMVAYAGLLVGVPQALLGIGGGVLLLPVLVYLVGLSTHAAVGTSLLVVFAGSIWGVFRHAMNFNISLPLVAALLVGSTFGSQLGALATTRLSAHRLRRYFAFVVVAAVLLLGWKLAGMFGLAGSASPAGPTVPPGGPAQLRLVTWNVLADEALADRRAPELLRQLGQSRAEVIALQEVAPWFLERLRAERWLADYGCSVSAAGNAAPGGLVILSRLPVERCDYLPLGNSRQGRGVLTAVLHRGDRRLAVATVHLESPLEAGATRAAQLRVALRALAEAGADDAVLLGDFNFGDNEQPETAALPPDYTDVWARLNAGPGGGLCAPGLTWNVERSPMAREGSFPGEGSRRLDRILVRSGRWLPRQAEVLGDAALPGTDGAIFPSDHFGLGVTLVESDGPAGR